MKKLETHEAPGLYSRMLDISAATVLAFPDDDKESVMELRAWQDAPEAARFIALADRVGADVVEATVRFPGANRLTGIPSDGHMIDSWHTLSVKDRLSSWQRNDGRDRTPLAVPARFAASFNSLMKKAAGQGWLLGIGWQEDTRPTGDFGVDPPLAEVFRVLPPEEAATTTNGWVYSFREAIGRGDNPEGAVEDAVRRLGVVSVAGA